MTPVAPPSAAPLAAAAFLLGPRAEAVDGLTRALGDRRVLRSFGKVFGRLTSAGSRAVYQRIAEVAAELADVDVADVVAAGWRRHTALADAARRTLHDPGSEELVDLATHHIRSVHRPQVEVLVDGVTVGSVPFVLQLGVKVEALVAVVRAGRLAEIRFGRGRLMASLSCVDVTIAAREADIDLAAAVALGAEGVPLLHAP